MQPGRGDAVPSMGTFGLAADPPTPPEPVLPRQPHPTSREPGPSSPRSAKSGTLIPAASPTRKQREYREREQAAGEGEMGIPRWADPYYFGSLEGKGSIKK